MLAPRADDYEPELAELDAEPEPDPQYNAMGVRTNTREVRARERAMRVRNDLILELVKRVPTYRPPPDWKPPKVERKLVIPAKDYPAFNFIGLILGPRGNTQKRIQRETNTKARRGRAGGSTHARGRGREAEGGCAAHARGPLPGQGDD